MPLLWTTACSAGADVSVGRSWPANQQVSMDQIDHAVWSAMLGKYVDARGNVNYAAWKASSQDTARLDGYLQQLSRASTSQRASREAQLAFWINAYNAVTIHGILREYPTSSIRNHTARAFGYNIWDDLKLFVGAKQYSLNQMEHEVLRKMNEPRIHFAIVCASIGCPLLRAEAYTADRLDAQLTHSTQTFFADRTKFQANPQARTIQISPILKWFATDFGANKAAQMASIAPYLPDAASQQLAASGQASISYLPYDWGLNDQAK